MIPGFHYVLRRKGEVVLSGDVHNSPTREAMEHLAAILFSGGSPGSLVYSIGLIDNEDYVDVDVEDTLGSHSGWKEITDYTRQEWVKTAVLTGNRVQTDTDEEAKWDFTTRGAFRGFFVTNEAILLSTAPLAESQFHPGDTLEVTYTMYLTA